MNSRSCITLIAVLFSFLFGCSQEERLPSQVLTLSSLSLRLDMTQAPPEIVSVRASLSREGYETLDMVFDITGSTASGTFEQVSIGRWHLKVDAMDSEDVVKFTGEMDVMVEPGYTEVNLVLNPADGSIGVNVRWASGLAGNALRLDGVNDHAIVNDPAILPDITDAFTLEAWIRPHDQYYNPVMTQGYFTYGWGLARGLRPGMLALEVEVNYSGAEEYGSRLLLFETVPEFSWSHVAFTFERDGLIQAFINGELVYQTTTTGPINTQHEDAMENTSFWIGGRHTPSGDWEPFRGDIDEVRVWNVARSGTEIAENLYSELNGDESGLVSYWNFNEPPGSTVANDATSNGNHATLMGGATLVQSYAF